MYFYLQISCLKMNNTTLNGTVANSNGTHEGCSYVRCLLTSAEVTLIVTSAFIVFLAGVIGNLCTAIVVISSKRFRSISNLSTLNLAFANLLLASFVGPLNFIQVFLISKRWVFGLVICKLFSFLKYIAVIATLLNLLVVSIERFVAICFPFFLKMYKTLFIYAVPLVWLIAMAFASPEIKFNVLQEYKGEIMCFYYPPLEWFQVLKIFNDVFFFAVMGLMIPLQIITIFMLKVKGSAIKDNSHTHFIRRRNACYMLFLLMLSCLVCWIPLKITTMLYANGGEYDFRMVAIVYAVVNLLFFLSTVIHPVIFFFLSPKGKRSLRAIMKKTKKRTITSPETSKSNDSGRRRTTYWPFSGISMRSSSIMTKDTAF